ncbi:MAG: radical SAM protein [Candidatus Nitrohelix vancouverensis]|uniref:Radical SAM protein n=1 Tax=Candidatus Nitrohelix vancouverensis TaxID=2705534 RepID=A0A7T0C2G2_9BACT|nr:MAG: radical SAM protein [Candidatus Nitrohelix vancouverensis]
MCVDESLERLGSWPHAPFSLDGLCQRFALNLPELHRESGLSEKLLRQNQLQGVVFLIGTVCPARKQLGLARKLLSQGLKIWFYWQDVQVLRPIDDGELKSYWKQWVRAMFYYRFPDWLETWVPFIPRIPSTGSHRYLAVVPRLCAVAEIVNDRLDSITEIQELHFESVQWRLTDRILAELDGDSEFQGVVLFLETESPGSAHMALARAIMARGCRLYLYWPKKSAIELFTETKFKKYGILSRAFSFNSNKVIPVSSEIGEFEIPDMSEWYRGASKWIEGDVLESDADKYNTIIHSPPIYLQKGKSCNFEATMDFVNKSRVSILLQKWGCRVPEVERDIQGEGPLSCSFRYNADADHAFQIVIRNNRPDAAFATKLRNLRVTADISDSLTESPTYLPHWGGVKRWLHARCKESRFWNSVVSALEMRLGREELLSLPQYMALCPTGQCQALCGFCSVTTNRTGIVKKELPFDKLSRFLAPVSRTIQMYGLEGNGEPALYDRFDDLVDVLTMDGAEVYLITNGERLTREQVNLLLARPVSSVNFSLNAATASTHARVMKLKDFEKTVSNIKFLTHNRLQESHPTVSVSFVVTSENIHEVLEFLEFCEDELLADEVFVRPLSELGGLQGVVEDVRELVPYENDVRDMIEGVEAYLSSRPRRSRVTFNAKSFRAIRPDPMDRALYPAGYEGRLLASRPADWQCSDPSLKYSWNQNVLHVERRETSSQELLRSGSIPVERDCDLKFRLRWRLPKGNARMLVVDASGVELGALRLQTASEWQEGELSVATGAHEYLGLRLVADQGALSGEIDFERLRTPGFGVSREFKLPYREHWQVESEGAQVDWEGRRSRVRWQGDPGPYLLGSYSTPCPRDTHLSYQVGVNVRQGELCIGVLDEGSGSWIKVFSFKEGETLGNLEFDTGTNSRLKVVLSSVKSPLDAEVDWGDLLSVPPGYLNQAKEKPSVPHTEALKRPLELTKLEEPQSREEDPRGSLWDRAFKRKPEYYCQKPWTDLNNFTVDGRMDVCCIATGPSQERYALGNIFDQEFQEIWNGERMREFRRTVNTEDKMSPCQRCPMAYSYQGKFFDPERTFDMLWNYFYVRWGWNKDRPLTSKFYSFSRMLFNATVFMRFKKQ